MLIKNARDYEGRICDYLIADGKIRAIGTDLPEAGEVINFRQPDAQHQAGLLFGRDRA